MKIQDQEKIENITTHITKLIEIKDGEYMNLLWFFIIDDENMQNVKLFLKKIVILKEAHGGLVYSKSGEFKTTFKYIFDENVIKLEEYE